MTPAAGTIRATALLAALAAVVVSLRRLTDRVRALHELVSATHELVTDCYHDLRALRVNPDGRRPHVSAHEATDHR